MKRENNIYALLDRSDRDFIALNEAYRASLSAQAISDELQIDIKNLCGNLRSALDYLAADIREKCCPTANPKKHFYFPVLPTASDFSARASDWFPGLATSQPTIWALLESIQPYQPGQEWLGQFNRLNNENKHKDLVPQTRVETPRVVVTMPALGSMSWDPRAVTLTSAVSIDGVPIDPKTQLPQPHPSQTVQRIIWVDFRFTIPDTSAQQLLQAAVQGVRRIIEQFAPLL